MKKEVEEVSNKNKRLTRTNAVVSMSKSNTEMDQINGDDIQNQTSDNGDDVKVIGQIQMKMKHEDEDGYDYDDREEKERFDDKEVDLIKETVRDLEEEKKVDQTWDMKVKSVVGFPLVDPDVSPTDEVEDDFHGSKSNTQIRMQSFVDLLMWKDMSRSALVFGIGMFLIITSFFTKNLNFSLISAGSYLGLLYLSVMFIYKSFICRRVENDSKDQRFQIREDDAIWLVKLVLPFLDEVVIKLRTTFSGDPEITMKIKTEMETQRDFITFLIKEVNNATFTIIEDIVAFVKWLDDELSFLVGLLLFVLATFGGVITIWTMGKLAFIGAFTIPKLYSSYSYEILQYGHFYMERCTEAWVSSTHKKAVAAISFIIFWNLCSSMARFWTLFMLAAALRYYQKSGMSLSGWSYENQEKVEEDDYQQQKLRGELTDKESNEGEVKVVNMLKQEKKKAY